jgi:hypothetical protein
MLQVDIIAVSYQVLSLLCASCWCAFSEGGGGQKEKYRGKANHTSNPAKSLGSDADQGKDM